MRLRALAAAFLALGGPATIATGQPAIGNDRGAAAGEVSGDEHRLAERRVALARRVLDAEAAAAVALKAAEAVRAEAAAAQTEAAARLDALRPLLPLARRLALWPAETLLAAPVPPADALLGLAILRSVGPRLGEAAAAARDAAALAARRAVEATDRAAARDAAVAETREAVAQLDQELAAARARRPAVPDPAAARAAADAGRARSLDVAIERLAARPTPAPQPRPTVGAVRPVVGEVTRAFGDVAAGGAAQGVTFAATPGARVVSPCAGRAVFAGPFRSYGRLLIVDCGTELHAVLAGLARLDAEAGARLLAGEPVGVLGGERPSLYFELRRGGQPVDPRSWMEGR